MLPFYETTVFLWDNKDLIFFDHNYDHTLSYKMLKIGLHYVNFMERDIVLYYFLHLVQRECIVPIVC